MSTRCLDIWGVRVGIMHVMEVAYVITVEIDRYI